ncbi:MAG: SpoIID/LytB domain-containing protein, partial [Gaiellaceae bacterium]
PERAPGPPVVTGRETARGLPGEEAAAPPEPDFASGRVVRVALQTDADQVALSASGAWRLYDRNGASLLVRADSGDAWTVERDHDALRAVRAQGDAAPRREAPFVARPARAGVFITVKGRPFRGEIVVRPGVRGLTVINHLALEDYLRGVVPLEIGPRTPDEHAAVEAQAIAARSYALAHVRSDAPRGYDLSSTVTDQVYGGLAVETPVADAAVAVTRALVITYEGRIIAAPYSAVCGGRTAAADEVWRQEGVAYLKSVSDRVRASGDHFYCEIAPRFRWTREFSSRDLAAALERNLRAYVTVRGRIGAVTDVRIEHRTPSGRVGMMLIISERGRYELHGNEIRFVFRTESGELLPSTMLSVTLDRDRDGRVYRLAFSGAGNGHGVGMCQWGAIGRARDG